MLHEDDRTIQSRIGKALLEVIGASSNLEKFEKNYQLKLFPNEERFATIVNVCKRCISHSLKEIRRDILKWIGEWEKQFFVENLREPIESDFDTTSSIANGKLRLTEKILSTWQIPY